MTSVIVTLPCGWMKSNQRNISAGVPSGRESFLLQMRRVEKCNRLEPVVAGLAVPEIGNPARPVLNPVRGRYRRAALGAGILVGQIAGIGSGHGASPLRFLIELDRIAVGYQRRLPSQTILW